LFALLFPLI